jgi:bla regulator protein blaR1
MIVSRAKTPGAIAILAIGLATTTQASGQPIDSASASFEVASVKRSDPNATKTRVSIAPGGRFTATNATVKMLIRQAFDLRDYRISGGPQWLDSENYDIEAKAGGGVAIPPGPVGGALLRMMLRSLLIERFGLAFHWQPKEEQGYRLVVDKGGSKFKAAEPRDGSPQGLRRGKDRLTGFAASLPMLASNLSQQLGRPVIDQTGLNGTYDFTLDYAPEPGAPAIDQPPNQDSSLPSIFTALQEQLGLKLESTNATVQILVIDHAERPSEN